MWPPATAASSRGVSVALSPAMGFYEWRPGPAVKQPFYIHVGDQDVFGFAGLWEGESFTIITVPANPLIAEIDSVDRRMPAILSLEARDVWLYGSVENAAKTLCMYPPENMVAYKVTARVDSLSNNDETLIEPLETDVD